MLWLLISLIATIVFSASACGNDREQPKKKSSSSASLEARKKTKSGSQRSSKDSGKSRHRSSRSGGSSKQKRSSASLKANSKSGKSKKELELKTDSKKQVSGKSGKSKKALKVEVDSKKEKNGRSSRKSGKVAKLEKKAAEKFHQLGDKLEKKAGEESTRSVSEEQQLPPPPLQQQQKRDVVPVPPSFKPVELRTEPTEMYFEPHGGLQTFKFVNSSCSRLAYKVKCSDNQLYRVAPVFGFLEPRGTASIDVLRQNGTAKVDKLVLVTAAVDSDSAAAGRNAKEVLAALPLTSCQTTFVPLLVDA